METAHGKLQAARNRHGIRMETAREPHGKWEPAWKPRGIRMESARKPHGNIGRMRAPSSLSPFRSLRSSPILLSSLPLLARTQRRKRSVHLQAPPFAPLLIEFRATEASCSAQNQSILRDFWRESKALGPAPRGNHMRSGAKGGAWIAPQRTHLEKALQVQQRTQVPARQGRAAEIIVPASVHPCRPRRAAPHRF